MTKQKTIILLIVTASIVISVVGAIFVVKFEIAKMNNEVFHEHANFALFINNELFDFSADEHQTITSCQYYNAPANIALAPGLDNSDFVHLHDNNGDIVHVHFPGITWRAFFKSLGMEFDDGKLVMDENSRYLANEGSAFYFFVNGAPVAQLADREIRDLDQVLISYADAPLPKEVLAAQLAQVKNDACVYSETCLHRGDVSSELCSIDSTKSGFLKWLGL